MKNTFGKPIFVYTRKQAIEDGVLVDVSEHAKELGIKFPVAITAAVQAQLEAFDANEGQDYQGRLHDLLWMFRQCVKSATSDTLYFDVLLKYPNMHPKREKFWAKCNGGDNGEPVITIMLTNED